MGSWGSAGVIVPNLPQRYHEPVVQTCEVLTLQTEERSRKMAGTPAKKGNCYLCGRTLSVGTFKRHLLANHAYVGENSQDCAVLQVKGAYNKDYWLYLDIPLTSTLERLDAFLREIWLECCGHMSAFYFGRYDEIGKSTKLARIPVGSVLAYDYDFGDTTSLQITVVAHASRPKQKKAVRLLGRNEPHFFNCRNCGKQANNICCECWWEDENPFFCDTCAKEHEHEAMLPITNSPRMGVCGYCGEFDVYEFDPLKFESK